ncbi:MAG TPA: Crp/Fnr family transcriptional regulator, partial [Bacteroidales bacterium]|nr:Crp/Fnr family transcriptional regulator [Bacteroidales bacterium]
MEGLYQSPLFEGLDTLTIDCLLDGACRLRNYVPGELVALQGDVYKSLLIVDKGMLRTEMTDPEGTKVTLEEIAASRTVAPAFIFATNNCLPVSIFAAISSSVVSIPRNKLKEIMHDNNRVLENFLGIISDRSRFLSERLRLLSFGT